MDHERLHSRLLIALLALALVLRLAYVLAHSDPPIRGDALHYDDIARNLADGNGFSFSDRCLLEGDRRPDGGPAPTARRPPLYPLLLAAAYRLTGHNLSVVLIFQALVSAATCYLLYGLVMGAIGNRWTAFAAAAMLAFYPPAVIYSAYLLTETLFLFLTLAAFWVGYRALTAGRYGHALCGGVLGALAYLTRPTAVFFPLLFAGLALSQSRPPGRRGWLKLSAAYVFAFSVSVSPWIVRNYIVFDTFIPGFTSAGYNLFMGTFPDSRGLANVDPRVHPEWLRNALRGKGEVETDRIYRRAALRNLREHPLAYPKLVAMKTVRGWFAVRKGHDWLPSPLSAAAHGPLLILAAAGAFIARRTRPFGVSYLVAGAVAFTAFHALVVANPRYNLPAVPFAMGLAAAAVAAIGARLRGTAGAGPGQSG